MKTLVMFLFILIMMSCSDPIHVTGHADDRGSTNGTLGSARAENQTPIRTMDSMRMRDSLKH